MKFQIVIEEILRRSIIVEAENAEEAKEMVERLYDNQEAVLDADDFEEVNFICSQL